MESTVLACIIFLAAESRSKALLALLPEERCSEIEAIRKEWKESSPSPSQMELRRKLETVRSNQLALRSKAIEELSGLALHQISPRLRSWLARPF